MSKNTDTYKKNSMKSIRNSAIELECILPLDIWKSAFQYYSYFYYSEAL